MNFYKSNRILAFILMLVLLLPGVQAFAGNDDFMRESGKIYVVVAVILVIFLGIATYLYKLDRNLTTLEHQIKDSDERTH